MPKARVFDISLFVCALAVAFGSDHGVALNSTYFKALLLYWLFSSFYFQLRVVARSGNTNIDYAISYTSSFAIFAGPLGALILETIYRFTVYFYKKKNKTADPGEFLDTFYNIGSFTLGGSVGYFLYQLLYREFQSFPFGFWILMFLVVCVMTLMSSIFLVVTFTLSGDLKTRKQAYDLLFRNRTLLDIGKVAFTNALLLSLLQMDQWEMLIGLFLLNYIVSLSFYSKSQSVQHKFERDKFEQMAYQDFLTGIYNRAYMDKKMQELDQSGEKIGIVVADIDKFKKINDSYNHAVGDQVIRHFADTLKANLQDGDILFRSGGEEFTLFLRNKSFEQCISMIERIRLGAENHCVTTEHEGQNITVAYSSSFGLYYYKAEGTKISMEKGYVCADQLLLESKRLGRNRLSYKNDLTS